VVEEPLQWMQSISLYYYDYAILPACFNAKITHLKVTKLFHSICFSPFLCSVWFHVSLVNLAPEDKLQIQEAARHTSSP